MLTLRPFQLPRWSRNAAEATPKPEPSRTHPTLLATCYPDDRVEGTVFEVTDGELEMADDYESGDYQRAQAPHGLGELDYGELLVDVWASVRWSCGTDSAARAAPS
jgi:hypothetical protein